MLDRESDEKFIFRRLEKKDYDKGFYGVLGQLTKVGEVPREQFDKQFDFIFPRLAEMYKIIIIEERSTGKLVGSGSVIFERKFIRNTGLCAHIEDIVVDK